MAREQQPQKRDTQRTFCDESFVEMKIIIIKKKRICTRVVLTARSIDTNKQQIECLLHTHTHTPGMAIINHSRLLTHFQSHRWERILQCQKIKMCVNIIYIEME